MWQIVLAVLLAAFGVIVGAVLLRGWGIGPSTTGPSAAASAASELPWMARAEPSGGVQVMGVTVGGASASRLEQVQTLWPGEAMKLAVVQSPSGESSLEAFLELVQVGPLQGKLILNGGVDPRQLKDWMARAPASEPQPSGARRYSLATDDLPAAAQAVVSGLVFLPAARLDEVTVQERFGVAQERMALSDGSVHLLHPSRGLVVSLDAAGKARSVLQFVPPAEFESRLRRPLQAAVAASGS